ncbi:hypothetical protein BaRGS_00025986 [Batillaria attramentaria]|uniref:Uncharacterized protein n=1 Tax=Batillaria attramentaria TaxID=370345 RepID=A0ABD0K7H1_9CAEN
MNTKKALYRREAFVHMSPATDNRRFHLVAETSDSEVPMDRHWKLHVPGSLHSSGFTQNENLECFRQRVAATWGGRDLDGGRTDIGMGIVKDLGLERGDMQQVVGFLEVSKRVVVSSCWNTGWQEDLDRENGEGGGSGMQQVVGLVEMSKRVVVSSCCNLGWQGHCSRERGNMQQVEELPEVKLEAGGCSCRHMPDVGMASTWVHGEKGEHATSQN